jgi:hypothetical protein
VREIGAHDVLTYCRDHRCSHHVETTADGWGDDVRLCEPLKQVHLQRLRQAPCRDQAEIWFCWNGTS